MNVIERIFNLQDRNIIIAGGAGQIGFAFTEIITEAGANVIVADIDEEMITEKRKKFSDELNSRISFYKTDVANKKSITAFVDGIRQNNSSIHGLVNCFHFKGNTKMLDNSHAFFSDFMNYPEEAWDAVHDVNLKGTFMMCQAVVPLMAKGSSIVNVSSTYGNVSPNKNIYGQSGINSPVAYASSKAAIINLSRYMATHLAEKFIRVNTLSPGGVFNHQSEEFVQNYEALTPLKRMATPQDYLGAIIFLLSDASSYMTGANLIIDGGWTAW